MKTLKTIITTASVMALAFVFVTNFGAIKRLALNIIYRDNGTRKAIVKETHYDLEAGVIQAMQTAHDAAYEYASNELDKWVDELNYRVDNEFLDDYFSFMETKRRELTTTLNWILYSMSISPMSAEEKAVLELEEQISKKIIKPELSQLKIENITREALNIYAETFDNELIKYQERYNIPRPMWNKYIQGVCGLTMGAESKKIPIATKTMIVSGIALTGVVSVPVTALIKSVSTKIAARNAASAAAKAGTTVVVKSAGKVAAKAGAKTAAKGAASMTQAVPLIGLGITAAICIWDIVEHAKTSRESKRILKQNLSEYFSEVKTELLNSSEEGIMGSIIDWENKLRKNISRNK